MLHYTVSAELVTCRLTNLGRRSIRLGFEDPPQGRLSHRGDRFKAKALLRSGGERLVLVPYTRKWTRVAQVQAMRPPVNAAATDIKEAPVLATAAAAKLTRAERKNIP